MSDPIGPRLCALSKGRWLALLVTFSLIWGSVMAVFGWAVVSLLWSFGFLEWTNALANPFGRIAIALWFFWFVGKAWGWLVDMRKAP